ncbi:hypothetical protein, partial [Megamonas hypermegale]
MKKYLLLSVFFFLGSLLCMVSPAQARVPYSYLNIGGLTPDQQINSAYYVYGRPTANLAVRNCGDFYINEVTYNSELMVYYINGGWNEDGRIRAIVCSEDNIATNMGVKVGMTKDTVWQVYGDPDKRFRETDGSTWCYLS